MKNQRSTTTQKGDSIESPLSFARSVRPQPFTPPMVKPLHVMLRARHTVLQQAYVAHPERFVKGRPSLAALPAEVWINRPQPLLELQPEVLH